MEKSKKVLIVLCLILFVLVIPAVTLTLLIPRFKITGLEERTIGFQSEYTPTVKACFGNAFTCNEALISEEGSVDTSVLGEYKVKYHFTYENHSQDEETTIKVVDEVPPQINVASEEVIYCSNGNIKTSYTATDDYDGDITNNVTKEIKDDKVIFTVTDSSGNQTTLEKKGILDTTGVPAITLNGEASIYVKLNDTYVEQSATASDDCDGDLTSNISIEGTVDTSKTGEYKLTYRVTDKDNNTSSVTRTVIVYNSQNPVTPTGKSIYLTFDDGPGPYTERLLNILDKYNVKVTFFVTNQGLTRGYDNLILRAYQSGHTIALHTDTHNYSTIYSSTTAFFNDLYAIQAKVKRITGYTSMIMRFPGGSSNTISRNYDGGSRIMSTLTKEVEARGFRYFDWNVSSGDAGETTSSSKVVSNVIGSLGTNSTYMVLQHDIKSYSVDAVESIITYGLSNDYTFRAITMDTPNVHHRVNN